MGKSLFNSTCGLELRPGKKIEKKNIKTVNLGNLSICLESKISGMIWKEKIAESIEGLSGS